MLKHISLTPEPKAGTFGLTQITDVAGVCARLGISPSDLQPQIFNSNLSRLTRPARSTPRLKPSSPISGVDMWMQRYEKLCSRVEMTRRVISNKQRLQAAAALDFNAALRSTQDRDQKIAAAQRAKHIDWQSRAQALQTRRDLVLKRVRKVNHTQVRESAELTALSESPRPADKPFPCAKVSPSVSHMSAQRSNEGDVSLKLAEIETRLKDGAKRAQENKRTISLTARSRADSESRRTKTTESESERHHIERIQALKQSSEQHIRNKQLRLSETKRKLNEVRSVKEGKVKQLLANRERLQKSLETSYYVRQMEREEQVERFMQARAIQIEQKSKESEAHYNTRKAAQQLLKDHSFAFKGQILSRLRQSDETVNSIRQIQDKIRRLRLSPSN